MNLKDLQDKHIDVETLPDEVHMQLTVHKLANELINMTNILEAAQQENDIKEVHKTILQVRLHMIKLVATMMHLFDWIDFGDIIQKSLLRKYMEEYLLIADKVEDEVNKLVMDGKLMIEREE